MLEDEIDFNFTNRLVSLRWRQSENFCDSITVGRLQVDLQLLHFQLWYYIAELILVSIIL